MNKSINKILVLFSLWYFIVTPIIVTLLTKIINLESLNQNHLYFLGIIIAPITYYIVYIFYKMIYKKKYNILNYIKNQFNHFKLEYLKGSIYGVILLIFIILLNLLFNYIFHLSDGTSADNVKGLLSVPILYTFLVGTVIIPFIEELVFRVGIKEILNDLDDKYYILISSILFAFVHIQNTGNIFQMINFVFVAFISGIFFSIIYNKYKSIWPSFITHFTYNFIVLLLQFIVK